MVVLSISSALAGAWVRDAGGAYVKLGTGTFSGAERAGAVNEGVQSAPLAYRDLSASLYAEVGLPAGFQASGYVPYVLAANDDGTARFQSFSGGDAEISVARRVLDAPVAAALTALAKVPLYGDRDGLRVERYGAYGARFPTPGDGQVDLDARLELGASLPAGRAGIWVQGWAGYRHRFGDYVDGVQWSVQLGSAPVVNGGRRLGWLGLEASGIVNPVDDPTTKSWTRFGAFAAVDLSRGLAFEAWGGVIPIARAARAGAGGGVAVSWTRPSE